MSEFMVREEKVKSNFFMGMIGAVLGALVGAVLWFLLYQIGIIASIAGIAMVTLACKGYDKLSKHLDGKGVFLSILTAILVLVATHFFCWGLEIYNTFKAEYAVTLLDGILAIPEMVFTDELLVEFVKEFLMGFILIIVGAIPYIKRVLHNRKIEHNKVSGLS